MAADVDAVIAALRVVLEEAQRSKAEFHSVEVANRWIGHLPGAWMGRWRKLILKGRPTTGDARRDELVSHVRAVLAFLEENRLQIPARRKWWLLRRRTPAAQPAPSAPATPKAPSRPVNLLRVRKPMPGVH